MRDTRRSAVTLRVRVPLAPLVAEPRAASEQVSQVLGGYTLEVLDRRDAWNRVRCPDAYEGWMHEGYLAQVGDPQARHERISLGCVVRGPGGRRTLPLGALLDADARVEEGSAIDKQRLRDEFPADAGAVVRSASRFFEGTSYEWGGITPWGADCSGFVQATFGLHGVALPRDAKQQGLLGATVEHRGEITGGDLLFFSERADGVITHVGLAIDARRMVHVALGRGGYAVDDLTSEADPYVRVLVERFRFARRVLPARAV